MNMRSLLSLPLGLLLSSYALAENWDNPANFSSDEVLFNFDDSSGIDPVYSTPTMSSKSTASSQSAAKTGSYRMNNYIPTSGFIEFIGQSSLHGTNSSVQVINAYLTMTPYKVIKEKWGVELKLNARLTLLDTDGPDLIDEDTLYTIGAQANIYRNLGKNTRVMFGVTPQISTDMSTLSRYNWYWGLYASISHKFSDNFRLTLGMAYMPSYYKEDWLPMINFTWKYNPNWEARFQATRLSFINVGSSRFEWGPFIQWNTNVWTVSRHGQTQQMRMRNCIAGISMFYNLTPNRENPWLLMADFGGTFYNSVKFMDKKGNEKIERYRSNAGLYCRLGAEMLF